MCALTSIFLRHAFEQRPHAWLGGRERDQLFVAARRAVAKADRAESLDLDRRFEERGEEGASRSGVAPEHPSLAWGQLISRAVESSLGLGERPLGVAAHEDRRRFEARGQRARLLGQRAPGEIASKTTRSGSASMASPSTASSATAIAVYV
jgi:hypothetical protein